MPTLNSAKVAVSAAWDFVTAVDIGTATHSGNWTPSYVFTDGTGENQAKSVFADERTLTASSTENLDLAGALTDVFGNTITFTKVKALIVQAASGNTNDVLVGGAASNGFISWVGDATDIVKVKPGGTFAIVAPDATGLAVTAGTGDILKIANSSSGTSVTYKIVVVGTV